MIEGGGLGVFRPEEVGPVERAGAQRRGRHAGRRTRPTRCGRPSSTSPTSRARSTDWTCADQRLLRTLVPENRLRVYDVRAVDRRRWPTPARCWSCGQGSGAGMVTALDPGRGPPARRHRQQPDPPRRAPSTPTAADKAARFLQLCDAFDLPVLFLCDTPGFMVGPEAEKTAQVRHFSRMFVTGASLTRAVLHDRAAQGLRPRARRPWPAAASTRRCSRWPGRPASSAAWASRAR